MQPEPEMSMVLLIHLILFISQCLVLVAVPLIIGFSVLLIDVIVEKLITKK